MKKLCYLLFATVLTFSSSSCKKKTEGCNDPHSLNYDANATDENNNLCQYSKATFYASSNTFSGVEVSEIILTIGQTSDTIGTITTFNQPYPSNCVSASTLNYQFITGNSTVWFAEYKLSTGGVVTNQGEFSPSNSEDCIKIDILP